MGAVPPRLALLAATIALVALGIVMVFSASSVSGALSEGGGAWDELRSQLLFVAVGTAVAVALARGASYHQWLSLARPLVLAAIVALAATLVFGVRVNGATRWLDLKVLTLQTSEFAKICIVAYAATIFGRWFGGRRAMAWLPDAHWGEVAMLAVPVVLILVEPDKGTTICLALTLAVMALAAGYDWRYAAVVCGLGALALVVVIFHDSYSLARVQAVMDPFSDPSDTGYQGIHGIMAFASGGLFGRGIGMGLQKYAYLPEAHNDFIFAVIGEELGFLGVLVVLACFGVLLWAGLAIARRADDEQGRLLALGLTLLLAIPAAINFAGVLSLVPLSGKAVPFLSAGGSSMLSSLIIVGLLVNVSRNSTQPACAHERRRPSLHLVGEEAGALPRRSEGRVGRADAARAGASSRSSLGSAATRPAPVRGSAPRLRLVPPADSGRVSASAPRRSARGDGPHRQAPTTARLTTNQSKRQPPRRYSHG